MTRDELLQQYEQTVCLHCHHLKEIHSVAGCKGFTPDNLPCSCQIAYLTQTLSLVRKLPGVTPIA